MINNPYIIHDVSYEAQKVNIVSRHCYGVPSKIIGVKYLLFDFILIDLVILMTTLGHNFRSGQKKVPIVHLHNLHFVLNMLYESIHSLNRKGMSLKSYIFGFFKGMKKKRFKYEVERNFRSYFLSVWREKDKVTILNVKYHSLTCDPNVF